MLSRSMNFSSMKYSRFNSYPDRKAKAKPPSLLLLMTDENLRKTSKNYQDIYIFSLTHLKRRKIFFFFQASPSLSSLTSLVTSLTLLDLPFAFSGKKQIAIFRPIAEAINTTQIRYPPKICLSTPNANTDKKNAGLTARMADKSERDKPEMRASADGDGQM